MGTIGDTLREARMRQQIDIAEVEEATKIRAKYLRALENEEFSLLPDAPRARSFLRTYAEALGLDARMLVEEYRANYEPGGHGHELQPIAQPPRRERERRGSNRRPPGRGALIAVLLVALLGFLLILGLASDDGKDGGSKDAGERTAEREGPTAAERANQREREKREARKREAAEAAKRRVKLRVTPAGPEGTYACVDNGAGKIVFVGVLTEAQTFRGKRLRINLGRRETDVRVNNEKIEIKSGASPIALDFRPGKKPKEILDEPSPCAP